MTDAGSPLEVPPRVLEYLDTHMTVTLATASSNGVPRAVPLRYANDGLTLYVWTRTTSWTAKQIAQNPLVSFTISEDTAALQGSGEARMVLSGDETEKAIGLFSNKFPAALGASTMNIAFFRIVPTNVKLIDETYGGGRGETRMYSGAEYVVDDVYDIVRDLPAGEVGLITGKLHASKVDAGDVIARQGAPADKFVIVVDGEVEVTRESSNGAETVITLGSGDFFGDVSIIRDSPRSATLTAVAPTSVLTMDREDFRSVVSQALGLNEDFDQVIRARLEGGASK
jgi:uncharacterized protein YhbP (UPF0306 family)